MEINFLNNNKPYRNPKKIARKISKVLNEDIYNDFLKNHSLDEISYFVANIIEYYILTDDKRTNYSFHEINELISGINTNDFDYAKYAKNPILANSCNGYSKTNIMKNGFLNRHFDSELEHKIEYCEDIFGKSSYLEYQNKKESNKDYMFFSFPGSLVVEYGIKMSPERLFMGILKQEYNNILPYEVGEGKRNYYKRVMQQKIEAMGLDDEKLTAHSNEIIDKMCSENPIINLFLSESKNNKIEAYSNFVGNGEGKTPIDISFGNIREDGQVCFFNGGNYSSNAANMVTSNLNIDKNEIGIIDIQDYFKCVDIKAHCLGCKKGDKVNFLTMELEQDKKENLTEEKAIIPEKKEFYQSLRNFVISGENDPTKDVLIGQDRNIKDSDEQSKTR